ncbi:hypothetical protein BKA59DRAFT_521327 [Fusarium tricinctum]|uniref:Uncharacterized protein n=1 Tax=Fusarium tricinctum TaxID=61284 RepID=A0A8K0S2P7_9HYPO|nr:hypothetical protein BKA59DRAFT_521327 [Fusarium tricinctum]
MVRNHPDDPFQRQVLVDRACSCSIRADLVGTVHGFMSPGKDPATLLVLDFRFQALKVNRRVKSADITLRFYGESDNPIVAKIVPRDSNPFQSSTSETTVNSGAEIGISAGRDNGIGVGAGYQTTTFSRIKSFIVLHRSIDVLHGSMYSTGINGNNAVTWTVVEYSALRTGIPPRLRTAILLKRSTDELFRADINIKAEVSGFSFRDIQDGLMDSEDDPVIFNPRACPQWPDGLRNHNANNLDAIDLSSLFSVDVSTSVDLDWDNLQADDTMKRKIAKDFGQSSDPEDSKSVSWFINLWDTSSNVEERVSLPNALLKGDLEKYFSWISESLNELPAASIDAEGDKRDPKKQLERTDFCNLIARQSSEKKLTTGKIEHLLSEPPVNVLSSFIQLPHDLDVSQKHDRGSCRMSTDRDGNTVQKACIIQTPFYSTGFWSLVLYSKTDLDVPRPASRLSGVIQADAGIDLSIVFSGVRELAEEYGRHESLLPIQLFKLHSTETSQQLKSMQDELREVDKDLLRQYEQESKPEEANKLYRRLNMVLHKCSMKLAELRQRRSFEDDLGSDLRDDLEVKSKLRRMVELISKMSKNLDLDVEALPDRIESQRNVLFNLITQHDSFLQARLAREALRDSKAMKTLAILTILFLPGVFIVTVFATNMFEFKSNGQQIWIYFVIVAPLTIVLMVGWVLWLKNTPHRTDEETGPSLDIIRDGLKGNKKD